MSNPPAIFERAALLNRHKRATTDGLFLQRMAKDSLLSRLEDVNRSFTKVAVVTPYPAIWADTGADLIAPTDVLKFENDGYDAVLHALCLHQFDDPLGQIIQCQRALKSDGLFHGAMFGGETLSVLRDVMMRAEANISGGVSPRIHPMIEIRDAGALLQRAGLTLPVADSDPIDVSFKSFLHLLHDLRIMGEANALSQRKKAIPPKGLFAEAALHYPTEPDGRISALFELIYLSGWAPHESQPQPLKPGSATVSLADFLQSSKSDDDN